MIDKQEDPFEGITDLNDGGAKDPPSPTAPPPEKPVAQAAPTVIAAQPAQPPMRPQAQPAVLQVTPRKEAKAQTRLARIRPLNKKKGNTCQTYTVFGIKFKVEGGWYRVSPQVAEYLEKVTIDGDPDSPEVFDVCTEEDAMRIEQRERARKLEMASAGSPHNADAPRDSDDARTTFKSSDLARNRRSMRAADE